MKTVIYKTDTELLCACNSEILLCLDNALVAANSNVIDAVLVSMIKTGNSCGSIIYNYYITYDENLLTDPTHTLVNAEVLGVLCKDCLLSYVENLIAQSSSGEVWYSTGAAVALIGGLGAFPIDTPTNDYYIKNLYPDNIILGATSATEGTIQQPLGTVVFHTFGTDNLFLGAVSGNATSVTGTGNTGVGTGTINHLSSGIGNAAVGINALHNITSGSYNVSVGYAAGNTSSTNNYNTFLGAYAGKYETGSNTLIIDSIDRGSEANGRIQSLLYGTLNAVPSLQNLTINGHINILSGQHFIYGSSSIANTVFNIRGARVDGSDDGTVNICGGGALGTTRGASLTLKGDDVGGAAAGGGIWYEAGTGTTGYHSFLTAGTEKWQISAAGNVVQNATNGGQIVFNKAATGIASVGVPILLNPRQDANRWFSFDAATDTAHVIRFGDSGVTALQTLAIIASTSDGDDDSSLYLSGGGGVGTGRGGLISLIGNDVGGAGAGGGIFYEAGTGVTGYHSFMTVGVERWQITAAGVLSQNGTNGSQILFNKAGTGIASTAIPILLNPRQDSNRWFSFDASSDTAHVMTFGDGGVTATQSLVISASTSDGDDDSTVSICGGGAVGTTRGASITLLGSDVGGAGAGAGATYESGTGTLGNHYFYTAGNLTWTLGAALTQDAANGGNIVFNKAGTGVVEKTGTLSATGSTIADAAQIVARVTFVDSSDGVKGVLLPINPTVGEGYKIMNTANAVLKVYPGEAGDQINAAGAGIAVNVGAYAMLEVYAASNSQWWGGELANP